MSALPTPETESVTESTNPLQPTSTTTFPADAYALTQKLSRVPTARQFDDEKGAAATGPPTTERQLHGLPWVLVCVSLYLSAFIYGLDTTIAADVQASVVQTFGQVEQLTWMGVGFGLGSVATILPLGALYGRFDMKYLYIASLLVFETGSAVCGASPSMVALIFGRVIAGMGGSGIYIGVLNYLSSMTSNHERGTYIALTGVVWGAGCILGPVIGGGFSVSAATWRWSFYINLVIAAVSAPVYFLYLPSMSFDTETPRHTKLAQIDWLGVLLSIGAWVSFTMVLTFAGATWPWHDGRTIALFVVFGVILTAFMLLQYFLIGTTGQHRIFAAHMLKSHSQVLISFGTGSAITGMFVPVYYIPLYFQFVQGDTALLAAVRLLPFVLVAITTNMVAGALLPRIGYYMPIYLVSGSLMIVGGSLMYTVTELTPRANVYGFSILTALAAGMTLQMGYSVATVKAALPDVPNAVSMQNLAQIGGSVVALVISGQVFQSAAFDNLRVALGGRGFTDAQIRSTVAGTQSPVFTALSQELKAEAVRAITQAISKVYILVIVAGAVLVVSSVFMRRERLSFS